MQKNCNRKGITLTELEAHRNGNKVEHYWIKIIVPQYSGIKRNKEEHYWIKIIVPQYSGIKRNKKEHYCMKKMFRNIKEQGRIFLYNKNIQVYKRTKKNIIV